MNSLYTSSAIKNRLCLITISLSVSNSFLEYKYPVGFPGLQIRIALVLSVTNFSKSPILGRAKPSLIEVLIGFTLTPADTVNPL